MHVDQALLLWLSSHTNSSCVHPAVTLSRQQGFYNEGPS